ncbi:30S ribosomal protein S7 [Candidatus Woesearchaeota archaeon]|nr:30S ribosomal protein S7 [Candidatus Woesearchaeota archaeon]
MTEILAFNRWSTSGIAVADEGLVRYINLEPRVVPKTGARYAGKRFHKSKIFIVERLINKLFIPGHKSKKHLRSSGHCTGKTSNAYGIVENAFTIIEQKIKENPLKVFVQALVNAAPREEIVTIEYGGARYPKAVECSPQRRLDIALRFFVQGSYDKSFKKKKSVESALADEIMAAYKLDPKSLAISKKNETERQADAAR